MRSSSNKWITLAIFVAMMMLILAAKAQELPKEPISKWVTEKTIFWHKNLPYYIYITDDTTDQGDLMKSTKQKKYSNPAYFDTYGWNFIRTKWAVDPETKKKVSPEQEIEWPVYVDGTPPLTKPKFSSKSEYLVNGVRYFTKDLIMTLLPEDGHSGVRSTYYSVNDSTYIKYIEPINLNPTDTFKVKYFSVDNVGNFETPKLFAYNADDYSIQYAIDAYAPVTKLVTTLIQNKYYGPNMEIAFSAKDKGSGVAFTNYMIDGGPIQVYDKPFTMNLPEGNHRITWFSVDRITNKEEEKTKEFIVDASAPKLFIAAKGYFSRDSIMFVSDSTKIKLSVYDQRGIKKLAYKMSSDPNYKLYTGPITLNKSYPARQDLRYFATDSVDNDSEVYVIKLLRDTSKPKAKVLVVGQSFLRGDTTFVTDKTVFVRASYDSLSGIGSDKLYSNGKLVNDVKFINGESYHVIDSVADNIGNTDWTTKIYKCDAVSPEINFVFSAPHTAENVYPQGTILFFSITDKTGVESFKITVNGKVLMEAAFAGKPGTYEVNAIAVDHLKQTSTKSITFVIR